MKQILLILCSVVISLSTYAQVPTQVSNVPQRYIFVTEWKNELLLKADTRTGKVWAITSKKDATKSTVKEYTNLPEIDESQSFDGRFTFLPSITSSNVGGGWKVCLMLDSKTGQLWQLPIDKQEATEITNQTEK